MRKIEKMLLLATFAVAAAALAAPAAASAATFYHEGSPIAEGGEIETFTGNFAFTMEPVAGLKGGVACDDVEATVRIEDNAANVESFDGSQCHGTGFWTCTVTNGQSFSGQLPWTLAVQSSTSLKILSMDWGVAFDQPCTFFGQGASGFHFAGNVSLTATTAGSLDQLVVGGSVESPLGPGVVSGNLNAANPGTFEFEV